jgi:hypothetical protein
MTVPRLLPHPLLRPSTSAPQAPAAAAAAAATTTAGGGAAAAVTAAAVVVAAATVGMGVASATVSWLPCCSTATLGLAAVSWLAAHCSGACSVGQALQHKMSASSASKVQTGLHRNSCCILQQDAAVTASFCSSMQPFHAIAYTCGTTCSIQSYLG